jgi:hypothetical protein
MSFGVGTLGLIGGSFVVGKVPAFGPPIVQKILPGAAAMLVAFLVSQKFSSNQNAKALAFGLGLAGFANVVNKLTSASAGQETIVGKINKATALPTLGLVQNYGGYPPEHFMYQGGNSSVPMNGLRGLRGDVNAFKLSGDTTAWKLDGF